MPRGHQDHQKQETLLAPSADRGPAPRADEPYRHCRQVPRRQVEASLHVEEPPLPRLRAPVLQPGVNPIKKTFFLLFRYIRETRIQTVCPWQAFLVWPNILS
jgi:hypothetical protein